MEPEDDIKPKGATNFLAQAEAAEQWMKVMESNFMGDFAQYLDKEILGDVHFQYNPDGTMLVRADGKEHKMIVGVDFAAAETLVLADRKPLKETAVWIGCPFCGDTQYPVVPLHKSVFKCRCLGCGLETEAFKKEEEALAYWNKRADVGTLCEL
jgi:Lar family restriction alleviation protein